MIDLHAPLPRWVLNVPDESLAWLRRVASRNDPLPVGAFRMRGLLPEQLVEAGAIQIAPVEGKLSPSDVLETLEELNALLRRTLESRWLLLAASAGREIKADALLDHGLVDAGQRAHFCAVDPPLDRWPETIPANDALRRIRELAALSRRLVN